MRTVTAIEFISVDGVMQGLGSPEEDTRGDFTLGGWGAPYAAAIHETVTAGGALDATSAYLFGRVTFAKMAAFWPTQPDDNPMAGHLNATPKYVVSTTLTADQAASTWPGSAVIDTDVIRAVRQLKESGEGTIAVLGSGDLVRQLLAADVVDTLQLFVHPLLLGAGTRLFGGLDRPVTMRLTNVSSTSLGTVLLTYACEH